LFLYIYVKVLAQSPPRNLAEKNPEEAIPGSAVLPEFKLGILSALNFEVFLNPTHLP
jgi:hypothetical protein